jgi:zinc transport system substrate-binding protein
VKLLKIYLIVLSLTLLMAGTVLWAGGGKIEDVPEDRLQVFVSILPQLYFVERVGGERVRVHVLVQPGQDPHIFEPSPRQMMTLNSADIYFGIGFQFEEFILRKMSSTNTAFTLVQTDRDVRYRELEEHIHGNPLEKKRYGENEIKGGNKSGISGAPDPHVWLAPPQIAVIVRNTYRGLVMVDPKGEPLYRSNLDTLLREINAVHERIERLLGPYRGRSFFVFHPSFGYFADAYGLKQISVQIKGKSPSPKQIEQLIERAKKDAVEILFVSPQFDQRSARTIADAVGGTVITIDPLGRDVLWNLEYIAMKIEGSFNMKTD